MTRLSSLFLLLAILGLGAGCATNDDAGFGGEPEGAADEPGIADEEPGLDDEPDVIDGEPGVDDEIGVDEEPGLDDDSY